MFFPDLSLKSTTFLIVCVTSVLIKPGLAEKFEKFKDSSPGLFQSITQLVEDAHDHLVDLIGKQTVTAVHQCFSQVVGLLAAGLASGFNVMSGYLTHFLRVAGLDVDLTLDKVTPEGVVYIGQWVLLATIGYWVLSLAFQLVASTLRRTVWLLKLGGTLTLFGVILSDQSVGTETIAIRLAGLVCVCVLLGVGSSGGGAVSDKTACLEQQVSILERRLREMERRRTEE